MNLGEMRDAVLGCVSRNSNSFVSGSVNLADVAINNALVYAQRKCDFEWNKLGVKLRCQPKGNLLSCVDYDGNPVRVKRIVKAFGTLEPTGHGDVSVPYLSRASQIADNTTARANSCACLGGQIVVHEGQQVYVSPMALDAEPYWLHLFAIRWLPRLLRDTDTNFIMEYGTDFILYKAVELLNFHVKEDERFGITTRLLNDSFNSLIQWDATHVSPTETEIEL